MGLGWDGGKCASPNGGHYYTSCITKGYSFHHIGLQEKIGRLWCEARCVVWCVARRVVRCVVGAHNVRGWDAVLVVLEVLVARGRHAEELALLVQRRLQALHDGRREGDGVLVRRELLGVRHLLRGHAAEQEQVDVVRHARADIPEKLQPH